jgi:hypothetical protein
MTPDQERYPWTQQPDETEHAYETFRVYLFMGPSRSLQKVADKLDRTLRAMEAMSSKHNWAERVRAYQSFIDGADVEDLAHKISKSRDRNLELVDKLRQHLSNRLDDFIRTKTDPTVRWTQALTAMAKLEQNAFAFKDDAKVSEKIDDVMELVKRVVAEATE